MKRTLLLAFFLLGCRTEKLVESPNYSCNDKCYSGRWAQIGVGQCRSGFWKCDDSDNLVSCEGEILPSIEVCDGVDNDCDAYTDETFAPGKACYGKCGTNASNSVEYEQCIDGRYQCPDLAVYAQLEICDGVDNDCDGQIDESDDLPIEFCYTGDAATLGKGDCHPGFKQCVLGKWICRNEKLPDTEICDGKDNDCDGEVDNNDLTQAYDIIFAIDDSGSMTTTINSVQNAVNGFAAIYSGSTRFKFALVRMTDMYQDGTVLLKLNFSDASVFNSAVMTMNASNGGGNEATLDVPFVVADPANPLGLNWTPQSKRILIEFTDEDAQTYLPVRVTESMAAQAVVAAKIKTYIFAYSSYWYQFDEIAMLSGGQMFDLSQSRQAISADLNTILVGACTQ